MRTLIVSMLLLSFSSCQKEVNTLPTAQSALAPGVRVLVPKEIYRDGQLIATFEYKDGRPYRSYSIESNGVAEFSYDEANRTTTSEYRDPYYFTKGIDHYDENGNIVKTEVSGGFSDNGTTFTGISYNVYDGGRIVSRSSSNSYFFAGNESRSEFSEKLFYLGPKLANTSVEVKNYNNNELIFESKQASSITWLNAFDFSSSNDLGSATFRYSPQIKAPEYFVPRTYDPNVFKNRDFMKIREQFRPGSPMLNIAVSGTSPGSSYQTTIEDIRVNNYNFPEEYTLKSVTNYQGTDYTYSVRLRYVYEEINTRK